MASYYTFCPAKINLFLAVTGLRPDGFHELLSWVTPVGWGDSLCLRLSASPAAEVPGQADNPKTPAAGLEQGGGASARLLCSGLAMPQDGRNLALRAASAFAGALKATRASEGGPSSADLQHLIVRLEKRIPLQAGLGGGSSNAAHVLQGLNALWGSPLAPAQLHVLARQLGADVPLFLYPGPIEMRGLGECIMPLPAEVRSRFLHRPVLIFKPTVGSDTAQAFARMRAQGPSAYCSVAQAQADLALWASQEGRLAPLLGGRAGPDAFHSFLARWNTLWPFVALEVPILLPLLYALYCEYGLVPQMSGSGTACFLLDPPAEGLTELVALIRSFWGPSAFVAWTQLGTASYGFALP